jgi:multidrug efflux pump subunit AcrA (membrane-fusion protein)
MPASHLRLYRDFLVYEAHQLIDTNPQTPRHPKQQADAPSARWMRRGLLGGVAIAVLVSAAAIISAAMSSPEPFAGLTYTIARGDLRVTVTEQGNLESSESTEIKCKVRGLNTVIWVVESGTMVKAGDELVRIDTLYIQEQIDERTKYAYWSRSAAEHSKARVATAILAVSEYEQGRYVSELMTMEKDLIIAESALGTKRNMLSHTLLMKESNYKSELQVEEREFAVSQARMFLNLKRTQLEVLKRFTVAEELGTLKGDLVATKATHEANVERAMADASRRDRALAEIEHCVVRAERSGLVIHPSAARWRNAPEIAEGLNVYKNQVMLLMPDLSKMEVKIGIHESIVDTVTPGMTATVTLPDRIIDGTVASVASVTRPKSWWTGNEVKYDTIIKLPSIHGLRPGTSADVEVLIAEHKDVLKIPVAAVVETEAGKFCWVKTARRVERRILDLGDTNGVFTVIKKGLEEGDEVVLRPSIFEQPVPEAKTLNQATAQVADPTESE